MVFNRCRRSGERIRGNPITLSHLQNQLQEIYELDIDHDVNDFLVTQYDLIAETGATSGGIKTREKLLIHQEQDQLLLSLYLHDEILSNLESSGNGMKLNHDNFEDCCLALEGISHFLYLIWNARYQRSVTLLEMELQAEIDKFIMLCILLRQQNLNPAPGQIHSLLFESVQYHDFLKPEELQRYRDANLFAKKYCWYLESRLRKLPVVGRQVLQELRRFYRLNQTAKLRHINYLH